MTAIVQLDMFKETTSEDILRAELEALKESHGAVRKRAFAEIRALQKMVMDQQEQIDYLKVKLNLACALPKRS